MAHFAELDESNTVKQVIVIDNSELLDDNGQESETKGIAFCQSLFGGNWVQTSYNGNFRKNFAGIGYIYDPIKDAFYEKQPYPSWVLNPDICRWLPPVPMPADQKIYIWNEPTLSWVLDPDFN